MRKRRVQATSGRSLIILAALLILSVPTVLVGSEPPDRADQVAVVEIKVRQIGPYEGARLPRWGVSEREGTRRWASATRDIGNENTLILVTTLWNGDSVRNQAEVVAKGNVSKPFQLEGREELAVLEFYALDDRLRISDAAGRTRTLLPGDRLTPREWPGTIIVFHEMVNEDEILVFQAIE